uniref:Uncharacterized protein n=1 Tax=Leersia perrieri TaxID=77586 RepID=A0A0D9XF59_9ORYZ
MCLVGLYIRFETLLEASNRRLVALHHRIVRTPPSSSSCFPSGDGGADLRSKGCRYKSSSLPSASNTRIIVG